MKMLRALVLIWIIPVLLTACAHTPKSNFGYYSQAERYYSQGDFKKAISFYKEYLRHEPDGNMAIIAHYYIAKGSLALGDKGEAKWGFENVIKKYPQSDWANFAQTQLDDMKAGK